MQKEIAGSSPAMTQNVILGLDPGIFKESILETVTLFFTVLFGVFVAEMGDKTQLMLIAMSSKYKVRDIVIGTAAAILVLNAIAVVAGGLLAKVLADYGWGVGIVACLAFFYFSVTSLQTDDDEEEEGGNSKLSFAPLAVFCTFFVAELGDKTQLASVAFGADNGFNFNAIFVWIAASIGLFAADIIGLVVGKFLNGKTPDWFFNLLSFILFAAFGFLKLPKVFNDLNAFLDKYNREIPDVSMAISIVAIVFTALVALVLVKRFKSKENAA